LRHTALHVALALGVALVASLVYAASWDSYFVSDTFDYIAEVADPAWSPWPYLAPYPLSGRHGINPSTSYYQPVQVAVVWLTYRLSGLDPRGYHLVQIALHAAGAAALYFAGRRLVTLNPSPTGTGAEPGTRNQEPETRNQKLGTRSSSSPRVGPG
jgi:hypothetical protein